MVLLGTMEHSIPASGQCYFHKADTQRETKQVHPLINRGAAGGDMALRHQDSQGKLVSCLSL